MLDGERKTMHIDACEILFMKKILMRELSRNLFEKPPKLFKQVNLDSKLASICPLSVQNFSFADVFQSE